MKRAPITAASVTGTKVLSDQLIIEVSANPGESLLDRMIALVEGASRQKSLPKLALSVLLAMLTLAFLIVVVTLVPMAAFVGVETSTVMLVALLVCLIPTTIGGLLPAIGIAGMERAMRANLVAKSGKAVEIAGSIDTLLLDKTGTITLGDRRATEFAPVSRSAGQGTRRGVSDTSLADPHWKVVDRGARDRAGCGCAARGEKVDGATFEAFSAETRLSGVDLTSGNKLRKGAPNAIAEWVKGAGRRWCPAIITRSLSVYPGMVPPPLR